MGKSVNRHRIEKKNGPAEKSRSVSDYGRARVAWSWERVDVEDAKMSSYFSLTRRRNRSALDSKPYFRLIASNFFAISPCSTIDSLSRESSSWPDCMAKLRSDRPYLLKDTMSCESIPEMLHELPAFTFNLVSEGLLLLQLTVVNCGRLGLTIGH